MNGQYVYLCMPDAGALLTFFKFICGILIAICAQSPCSSRFIASHCVAHVKGQKHNHNEIQYYFYRHFAP